MEKKTNNTQRENEDDLEDIIERLEPCVEEDVLELEGQDVDRLFQEDNKSVDPSIDALFEEDRKVHQKGLQDEVQKALIQPAMSKASLYRMRVKEPTEEALTAEIAKLKTVEEIWEEPVDNSKSVSNRRPIIAMCVIIALIAFAGSWALWKSTHDEKGNKKRLTAQENEIKQRERKKQLLAAEITDVSKVVDDYLSAITVTQKCEYIYKAEVLRNDIEQYYEKNGGVKPASYINAKAVLPITLNGQQIWEVTVKDKSSDTEEGRRYYVRENTDGEYKVDWKADVGFQESDVKKFKESRSKEGTIIKFKVDPSPKRPTYNWGFKDTEYKVVNLTVPNSDMVFWGYVKKNSTIYKKMHQFLSDDTAGLALDGVPSHSYILKVRFLEDSPQENDRYILIDELVSRKWVNTDE